MAKQVVCLSVCLHRHPGNSAPACTINFNGEQLTKIEPYTLTQPSYRETGRGAGRKGSGVGGGWGILCKEKAIGASLHGYI